MYIREDQAAISVSLDGLPYGDSWKSVEGGNLEADNSKTRPGGMGKQVDVGGPGERDDITVATQLTDVTVAWIKPFERRVGVGRVNVGTSYLSAERTPVGAPHVRSGILKGVNVPDSDSESSDAGMLEIVVGLDEEAS